MKHTPLWASAALLLLSAPTVLATGASTASTTTTTTSASSPSCTASQIASLCSYPEPDLQFAVASDSRASCWNYCNTHGPCNFVIFVAGNPNTGTGTCWLYPGQTYNASAGSTTDCNGGSPSLFVYDQPKCVGGSPGTATAPSCAATATPSALASICGYPPPGDCFYGCTASEGASNCLSQCANAASCAFVVFNPHNPTNSPYGSGTCWIYANGTYDAKSAAACTGAPEQFVYNNVCPKPAPASSSSMSSPSSASLSLSSSGSATTSGGRAAGVTASSVVSSKNSAPTSHSRPDTLAIGIAVLIWQGSMIMPLNV